jgi:hypothetical protein
MNEQRLVEPRQQFSCPSGGLRIIENDADSCSNRQNKKTERFENRWQMGAECFDVAPVLLRCPMTRIAIHGRINYTCQ